jgi:uncharacterized membrane protein YfcA
MQIGARRTSADLGIGTGVGAFSGAFGVGGGILLVPFLVLARKVPQKQAQATSLVMVAMAAAAGAVRYAFSGEVAWLPALVITIGGLAGAWLGAVLVQRSPNALLQGLFGLMLMAAGVRMLWPTTNSVVSADFVPELSIPLAIGYLTAGVAMGTLSAMFGIGGGILLIPILVFSFGYDQHLAAGTSLAVMLPIALLGAIRLTPPGLTQWNDGIRFGAGAIIGALLGASVALALSGSLLQIAFGVLMLIIGGHMAVRGFRQSRTGISLE